MSTPDRPKDHSGQTADPALLRMVEEAMPHGQLNLTPDVTAKIAEQLAQIAKDVQLPNEQARSLALESARNKEKSFGYLLDLHAPFDRKLEILIFEARIGPSLTDSAHAPFWLKYLTQLNIALQEESVFLESDPGMQSLVEISRETRQEYVDAKKLVGDDSEMELRDKDYSPRANRAQLGEVLLGALQMIEETEESSIFAYDSESQVLKNAAVGEIYRQISDFKPEDLKKNDKRQFVIRQSLLLLGIIQDSATQRV